MEAEGSVLKYVTKAEYRKQHSSLPLMKHPVFCAKSGEITPIAHICGKGYPWKVSNICCCFSFIYFSPPDV